MVNNYTKLIKCPTKSPISSGLVRETDRKKTPQILRKTPGREKENKRQRKRRRKEKGEGRGRGILMIGANKIDYSFQSVMGWGLMGINELCTSFLTFLRIIEPSRWFLIGKIASSYTWICKCPMIAFHKETNTHKKCISICYVH